MFKHSGAHIVFLESHVGQFNFYLCIFLELAVLEGSLQSDFCTKVVLVGHTLIGSDHMFGILIRGQLVLRVDLSNLLLELFCGCLPEVIMFVFKLLFRFHDSRFCRKHSLFCLIFLGLNLGNINLFLFIDLTLLVIVFHVVLVLHLLDLALNLHLDKRGFLMLLLAVVGLEVLE